MHRIRLREPWQSQPAEAPLMAFSRKFNAPTGLEPEQSVELFIELSPLVQLHSVLLNDHLLLIDDPPATPLSFAIEQHLQPFNHLQLTFRPATANTRTTDTSTPLAVYAQVQLAIH